MRKVLIPWAVLTLLLTGAFYFYLDSRPSEEFDLANATGFKIVISLVLVGGGAAILLFLVLFFGAIIRSLRQSR